MSKIIPSSTHTNRWSDGNCLQFIIMGFLPTKLIIVFSYVRIYVINIGINSKQDTKQRPNKWKLCAFHNRSLFPKLYLQSIIDRLSRVRCVVISRDYLCHWWRTDRSEVEKLSQNTMKLWKSASN